MSRTKDGLKQIVGKTVASVVMTENEKGNPRSQLFLIFCDGNSFEFWVNTDDISTASSIDRCGIDQIIENLEKRPGTKLHIFRLPHEDPDAKQRDLLT